MSLVISNIGLFFSVLVLAVILALPASFYPVAALLYALLFLAWCFELSYVGIVRFSRYRLSQSHRYLNMVVSVFSVLAPFIAFLAFVYRIPLAFPFVLLVIASYLYVVSLFVSPDNPEEETEKKWYKREFFLPLIQASLFLVVTAAFIWRSFGYFMQESAHVAG